MKRITIERISFKEIVNDNTIKSFKKIRDLVNRFDKEKEKRELGFCIDEKLKPTNVHIGYETEIKTLQYCYKDTNYKIKYAIHLHPYAVSRRQIEKDGNLTPYFTFDDLLSSDTSGFYPCLMFRILHDEIKNGKRFWYNTFFVKCAFNLPERMVLINKYSILQEYLKKNIKSVDLSDDLDERIKKRKDNRKIYKKTVEKILLLEKEWNIRTKKLFTSRFYG